MPERSAAIAEWARGQFPGKEITHVIATHHHFDHAGGLRYFVAKGATIITAETSKEFLEREVFGAACTLLPDALAAAPRPATFQTVPRGGTIALDDPTNPVHVHQIESGHAADMSIAYLPNQRALFNSDLYTPLTPALRQAVDWCPTSFLATCVI